MVKGQLEAEGFSGPAPSPTALPGRRGFRYSRDARAVARRSAHGRRVLAERWAGHEWDALLRAHERGSRSPTPSSRRTGSSCSSWATPAPGAPAGVGRLSAPELSAAHDQLMEDLARLTRAGLVHADLSPYNVLVAGPGLDHRPAPGRRPGRQPGGLDLLHHDVTTVCRWFAPPGVACDGEAARRPAGREPGDLELGQDRIGRADVDAGRTPP